MNRQLLLVLLCALAARWSVSFLTESRPLFPDYAYGDARIIHGQASQIARIWHDGKEPYPFVEPSRRIYATWTAALYWAFGERLLIPKLANGVFSVGAIYLWALLALRLAGPKAALIAAGLLALWPSHVFFSSQAFREAQLLLMSALALYLNLRAWDDDGRRAWPRLTAAALALLAVGLFRTPLMLLTAAALAVAAAVSAWKGIVSPRRAVAMLAGPALVLALFNPVSTVFYRDMLPYGTISDAELAGRARLLLRTQIPTGGSVSPLSPEGLSRFRKIRHLEDQVWAEYTQGRRIETQVFPDAEFKTWLDVALFIPKSTFFAVFMPLPGLYPTDGKLSRKLAGFENLAVLVAAALALLGLRRVGGREAWALGAFFALVALSYGLFEFDLGGATRHRLIYVPCLFLFAAALFRDGEPAAAA